MLWRQIVKCVDSTLNRRMSNLYIHGVQRVLFVAPWRSRHCCFHRRTAEEHAKTSGKKFKSIATTVNMEIEKAATAAREYKNSQENVKVALSQTQTKWISARIAMCVPSVDGVFEEIYKLTNATIN